MKVYVLRLINRLKRVANFPVFGETLRALRKIRTETEATPDRLVRIVLLDPGLCCQTLRAGNSVFYNPTGYPMRTVSRAVVILGLQNLKALAESSPMLPAKVLSNNYFNREMAIALLAAHLAAKAARKKNLPPEEAYLGSLFRRLGRLVLLIYAPDFYQKIRSLPSRKKKELFHLVGERLAQQWNLPENIIDNLEGRELYLRPKKLGYLCLYADILAAGLVSKNGPLGWQNLFDNPEEIKQVLKSLREKSKHLPLEVSKNFPFGEKIEAVSRDLETKIGPFLPEEALRLAQKVLESLCEEISAEGELIYREGERLFTFKEGRLLEEKELLNILGDNKIVKCNSQIFVPIQFKGFPAILFNLQKNAPLSPEETYGLKLIKKTIESILERI